MSQSVSSLHLNLKYLDNLKVSGVNCTLLSCLFIGVSQLGFQVAGWPRYWSIASMQRILWAIGHEVGPTASKWIEEPWLIPMASIVFFFFVRLQEKRELWEGQKGRRLSSSVATDKQAVAAYQWGSSGG